MMRLRYIVRSILVSIALLVGFVSLGGGLVAADVPNAGGYCTGSAAQSAICQDRSKTDNPISGKDGILLKVVNIIAVVAGAAAVIMIIINGLKMVTSEGSSEGVASARRGILYTLAGLVVIVLARFIIGLLLSAL